MSTRKPALPGYADLWVSGFLLALVIASAGLQHQTSAWAQALVALLAVGRVAAKDVAMIWLGMWLLALVLSRPKPNIFRWLSLSAMCAFLVLFLMPPFKVQLPLLGHSVIAYHGGALSALAQDMLWFDNWHFPALLLVAASAVSIGKPASPKSTAAVSGICALQGVAFLLFTFLFTKRADSLLNHTQFNRGWLLWRLGRDWMNRGRVLARNPLHADN